MILVVVFLVKEVRVISKFGVKCTLISRTSSSSSKKIYKIIIDLRRAIYIFSLRIDESILSTLEIALVSR